jgi:hypothetical protein
MTPDARGYRCSMIVNPRITNPSIPKHSDMIDIVIPSSISLVPEPVKGLLKTFNPTLFALTLRHCGSPSFALLPSWLAPVSEGRTERANNW